MKRIRKPLAVILGIAMILSMVPMMAFAQDNGNDNDNVDYIRRIAGNDRYHTARLIAEDAFGTSDNVIVARGDTGWDEDEVHEQFPDALAGSLLAQSKDAPILLTFKDSLHPQTQHAIENLGASKVYILGGYQAISGDVETAIEALDGVNEVERVYGPDRNQTAVQIAEAGDNYGNGGYGTAFIANGHASSDAMVAGAKAFEAGLPIFLVRYGEIPSGNSKSTYEALQDEKMGIDNVIIVGGEAVISAKVEEELVVIFGKDNVNRLAGKDRLCTAQVFAEDQFENPLQFYIVNGHTGLADAVTGSVFGDPILFSDRDGDELPPCVQEYLTELLVKLVCTPEDLFFTLLGGTVRLADGLVGHIRDLVESVTKPEIEVIGAETIIIPEDDAGSVTASYTAKVKYQFDKEMTDKEVTWSVEDVGGSDVNDGNVTIDPDGVITVTGQATEQLDSFKVVATCQTDPDISGELTVNLVEVDSAAAVDLGKAGDYVILSYAGITNVPNSAITGDIGVSPIASTAITGFSLTMDLSGKFATSDQITGNVYAADYDEPTPSDLTTAVGDKGTAYTDAAGRTADYTEAHAGDLSGETLVPGVYKWDTDVVINDNVTLDGGGDENAVWIFQISGQLTQAANTSIILAGDAQAENIFWQVAETVSIGTEAHFEGIVLGWANIVLSTDASVNGRLFALKESVTLIENTITEPQ